MILCILVNKYKCIMVEMYTFSYILNSKIHKPLQHQMQQNKQMS